MPVNCAKSVPFAPIIRDVPVMPTRVPSLLTEVTVEVFVTSAFVVIHPG